MEPASVLAAYNAQVRRSVQPDGSGARAEAGPNVVRWVTVDGTGWSGVVWSDLDEANADRVIAEQVAFFRDRDEKFEWKLYDYDQPVPSTATQRTTLGPASACPPDPSGCTLRRTWALYAARTLAGSIAAADH